MLRARETSSLTQVPKVLIVDDDDGIRSLLSAVCKRVGYDCDNAEDGSVALEKLRSSKFDVVLLDLMMPKLNGYQVIEVLRKMKDRPQVIVVTAQGAKTTTGIEDGVVVRAVIHKPFDLDDVTSMLISAAHDARDAKPEE
jgi:DNA-binding response OmpR family regulator